MRADNKGPKIVFTTYQSSSNLAAAARKARVSFDLAVLDEAHKTVGKHSKTFATLLNEKKISIRRRLFMTATERVARSDREDVLSMENERDYGARFFQLSFKEAIKQRIIADYKVLTLTVSDRRIRSLIDENRILDLNPSDLDEAEAQSLAGGIALKRVYDKHGIKHAISFHRSIRAADRFREQQDALNRAPPLGPRIQNFHISSKKTAGQRSRLLKEFVEAKRALMTNARCLTEGVDVPAIDCVMFADPKQSRIDIVQAAGRALREYPGKQCGYIVVPLIVPEHTDFDSFAETTAFRQVAQTITALSTQDERIAEEFRSIEKGRVSKGKIVEIDGDVPVGMKMKLGEFAEAISTRVWESVGRANWRPFEEARDFARSLGMQTKLEWPHYCQSGKKPEDIPADPRRVYAGKGWVKWGDWLGTGNTATHLRQYQPFTKARAFVRGLGLQSGSEWKTYCRSGKKPDDIPNAPSHVYAKEGWAGLGNWLGTGRVASHLLEYRSFREARAFARSLGLKSHSEWSAYCKSGKKPDDIPAGPARTYADDGWVGMGDWLGTGRVADQQRQYRPFKEARAFVHALGLKSGAEWKVYGKSGKKPDDIPASPNQTYADDGWLGMGDWLGSGNVATYLRQHRSFTEARAFVRSLGLKSRSEWESYCKSGKKPDDIPNAPWHVYAAEGWAGAGDWLGTGNTATHLRQYQPFTKARAFVRGLGLQSGSEWKTYCRSGKKPDDIPSKPDNTYAKAAWAGMGDWLGTGRDCAINRKTVLRRRRKRRPETPRLASTDV